MHFKRGKQSGKQKQTKCKQPGQLNSVIRQDCKKKEEIKQKYK